MPNGPLLLDKFPCNIPHNLIFIANFVPQHLRYRPIHIRIMSDNIIALSEQIVDEELMQVLIGNKALLGNQSKMILALEEKVDVANNRLELLSRKLKNRTIAIYILAIITLVLIACELIAL